MKIFHIGLCVYDQLEGLSLALSKDVEYKQKRPETPDNELVNIAMEFDPDLIFMQIQAPDVVSPEAVKKMGSRGAIIINWTGDLRMPIPLWYKVMGQHCITCFSNEENVREFKRMNLKSEYLQIGIDPEIFNHNYPSGNGADIVFMANHYGRQFPNGSQRLGVINQLKRAYGNQFKVIGNGWPSADGNLNGNQREEANYYNNSKIAISVSNFDFDRYFSDRLIRILGSGCFCISHHYKGIEKDFEVGKHLETFKSPMELIQKIRHYLNNERERNIIALNGYKLVHDHFTYDSMVDNMYDIYDKYNADN